MTVSALRLRHKFSSSSRYVAFFFFFLGFPPPAVINFGHGAAAEAVGRMASKMGCELLLSLATSYCRLSLMGSSISMYMAA